MAPNPRKRKASKANLKQDSADFDEFLAEHDSARAPSFARMTEKGGYAHTDASRRKIGEANRGKMPWNKGKSRSEDTKANIGAAVRARNAAILKLNLEKIGLTDEGYQKTKSQLKYMRERLRKAKISYRKQLEQEKEEREKLKAYLEQEKNEVPEVEEIIVEQIVEVEEEGEESEGESEEDGEGVEPAEEDPPSALDTGDEQPEAEVRPPVAGAQPTVDGENSIAATAQAEPAAVVDGLDVTAAKDTPADASGTGEDKGEPTASRNKTTPSNPQHMPSVFRKDIKWNASHIDDSSASYGQSCPSGGPGGLICCSVCTASYSTFLLETHQNLETQQVARVRREFSTLGAFLTQTTDRLKASMAAAKKKPPPLIKKKKKVAAPPS